MIQALIVDDYVIGQCQALAAPCLCFDDVSHLVFGIVIASHGAGNLQRFGYVDDQYSVAPLMLAGLKQQRIH